jgi:hypothetical protein
MTSFVILLTNSILLLSLYSWFYFLSCDYGLDILDANTYFLLFIDGNNGVLLLFWFVDVKGFLFSFLNSQTSSSFISNIRSAVFSLSDVTAKLFMCLESLLFGLCLLFLNNLTSYLQLFFLEVVLLEKDL